MKTKTFLALIATLFAISNVVAQQGVVSSGGDAEGNGGSASFSTGQIAYTTISGSGGTATQGIQQPFEIFVLGLDNYPAINLSAIVYPNPAVSSVSLRIELTDITGLRYEFYDTNGRLLNKGAMIDTETIIDMEKLPASIYIIKVYAGIHELKSFKIIKRDP